MKKQFLLISLLSLTILLTAAGCQVQQVSDATELVPLPFCKEIDGTKTPRIRLGTFASSTIGTRFTGLEGLGEHGYNYRIQERNGIVYTCRGGHIDLSHVRKGADWTAYLTVNAYKKLMTGQRTFSFRLEENSVHIIEWTYPENWQSLPQEQRETIAFESALAMGGYFSYMATTWHEILTWFGYKSVGLYPEFPSAFSWEDTYSNLLGARIGMAAIQDTTQSYNQVVTEALANELENLGIQSGKTAKRAAQKMRGKWFSGYAVFVDMKGRNFDIGLNDGSITPWVVPNVSQCPDAEPQTYPTPTLDIMSRYGFEVKYEIEPKEWEKYKILRTVYPDKKTRRKRIVPETHFGRIMAYIEKQTAKKHNN